MNQTLSHLETIVRGAITDDKLLIVSRHAIGNSLTRALALRGVPVINLRVVTLEDLAVEAATLKLAVDAMKHSTTEQEIAMIEEVFIRDIQGKDHLYFGGLHATTGYVKCLHGALTDLRYAGITASTLDARAFVVPAKYKGLHALLEGYENALVTQNLADTAAVFRAAIECVNNPLGKKLIVYDSVPLSKLEREFLTRISGDAYSLLPTGIPMDVGTPRLFARPSTDGIAKLTTASLWDNPFIGINVTYFRARSPRTEVREVIRRVVSSGQSFDKVEVACTEYSSYSQQFYLESVLHNVPCTFAEGVSATITRTGRAALAWVEWIASDFQVTKLRELLEAGIVANITGTNDISIWKLINLLREAKVGWFRERYGKRLAVLRQKEVDSDKEQARHDKIDAAINVCEGLLSMVPMPGVDGTVFLAEFFKSIANFVALHAKIKDETEDVLARSQIADAFDRLSLAAYSNVSIKAACIAASRVIEDLRVNNSTPKPGHVHIAPIHSAGFCARPINFLVGLDDHSFPGGAPEDPIVLDEERKKLNEELVCSEDMRQSAWHSMLRYLSSVQGSITLSVPVDDIAQEHPLAASPLLLQAYRWVSSNEAAGFDDLTQALGEPCGYAPEYPLEDSEWWMRSINMLPSRPHARQAVLMAYPDLEMGLHALEARGSDLCSEYDGIVSVEAAKYDPRITRKPLSASYLESIAKCPFNFFVKHILSLNEPQDFEYDPSVWLDPMTRGTLLHGIYEDFLRAAESERTLSSLTALATRHIEAMAEEIPPPAVNVYSRERADLLDELRIFEHMLASQAGEYQPRYLETVFGMEEAEGATLDVAEPVPISVGSRTIMVRGKIDRLDENPSVHQWRVVDYKTGGSGKVDDRAMFENGKELQLHFYGLAAEKILQRSGDAKASVVQGEYWFPTKRGSERPVKRRLDPVRLSEVLEILLDAIANGTFMCLDPKCYSCKEYGFHSWDDPKIKAKLANPGNVQLNNLRRLEDYA